MSLLTGYNGYRLNSRPVCWPPCSISPLSSATNWLTGRMWPPARRNPPGGTPTVTSFPGGRRYGAADVVVVARKGGTESCWRRNRVRSDQLAAGQRGHPGYDQPPHGVYEQHGAADHRRQRYHP